MSSSTNGSLCTCGKIREKLFASPQAKFPNRAYFKCRDCGKFDWADAAPSQMFDQEAGPFCKCRKASVQRAVKKEGRNKGRKFWSCASYPRGCNFFEWKEQEGKQPSFPTAAAAAGQSSANVRSSSNSCSAPIKPPPAAAAAAQAPANAHNSSSSPTKPPPAASLEGKQPSFPNTAASAAQSPAGAQSSSSSSSIKPPAPASLPALPGFASFLSDWKTLQLIEKMMEIDPHQLKSARSGLGVETKHDKLQVKGVWHISNPSRMQKYQAAKKKEQLAVKLASSPDETCQSLETRQDYRAAMMELGKDALDQDAGEVFLLYGTRPESLFKILFEGLDPEFASDGLFGRGVYFADDASKIDMYASMDPRFDKDGPLMQLHKKIYAFCPHPRQVRYALIARVLLGRCVKTQDGETRLAAEDKSASSGSINGGEGKTSVTSQLFQNKERSKLACFTDGNVPSSLVALPDKKVSTFREYVIFNPDQVFVEYLVAYQRARGCCDCGVAVAERTVSKAGPNRGRKIHLCGKIAETGQQQCNFMQMYPLCYCSESADIKTSHSPHNPGRSFYCCHKKGKRYYRGSACDFFTWADNAPSSTASSSGGGNTYKRQRFS